MSDAKKLHAQFARDGALRFEAGPGGLTRATIDHAGTHGEIYLHGAHVTAWNPPGERPVIWMSGRSYFEPDKPIRGGVPICFPWFGPKQDDPAAPAHGLARLREWEVIETRAADDGAYVVLRTAIDPFVATFTASFGEKLRLTLRVQNTSEAPAHYEAALHTYFSISDIKDVTITGLESVEYLDKVDEGRRKRQDGPIRFTQETDRVYVHTRDTCVLHDPGFGRRIVVGKAGSDSTVVWNPWIAKAARMPDFGDDEWPGMVCIETCNVGENSVTLAPGASHETTALIEVERA